MNSSKLQRVIFCALICALAALVPAVTFGQDSSQSPRASAQRDEDVNLEMQLYLILASNREVEDTKPPAVLDPVIKQLRESLPFKHFNLSATFLNRVKNNGQLDVSWVGGPFVVHGSTAQSNPSFSQFTSRVKLVTDENGHLIVRLNDFRFGTRVPIVTGPPMNAVATTNAGGFPTVNYEPVGLRTDLSLREGSLVIAGTLNVGPSGDALIVAVAARRAN